MRRLVRPFVGALLVAAVATGCSSGDDASPSTTADGATTTALSIVPITTTTTIAGEPISDDEIYASVGLTTEQGACIEESGAEGEFETTPNPDPNAAMVLTADSGDLVAVPASLKTSTELEALILTTLAADCAPAELLTRLADVDGRALDEAAIADDLPERLDQRRRDGADDTELACVEAKFREYPARLSSLAANARLVESQCVSADRLTAWRTEALRRGLAAAGATPVEQMCIAGKPSEQVLLAAAVDAVGSGDTTANPLAATTPECASSERMNEVALGVVTSGADFGVEALGGP